jgi:predicted nucleotidyltransferase
MSRMDSEVIAPLPGGYHELLGKAWQRLETDARVRALWLSGSVARGEADAASDLDMIVTVADEDLEQFAATWRDWLADITPTVLAEPLPFAPGSFYSITPGFERLDVVVESASQIESTHFVIRAVVFDHDNLIALLPSPGPGPGPSPATVSGLIQEFFRVSAIETVIVRQDWLLAREHIHLLSSLTYQLFVQANAPMPAMGVKQWSAKLTAPQIDAMTALPTDARTLDELRHAQIALASLFVTNAEALATELGLAWPTELETAAAAHLHTTLGVPDPYPRTAPVVLPVR